MRRTRILTALALMLALGLTACGQDGDDGGVATLDNDPSSSPSDDDVPDDIDEQAKKFEECMTDHDVDMEDGGMSAAGPGGMSRTEERSGDDTEQDEPDPAQQEKFDAAFEECQKYMPTQELSPEEEAELRETALAYTECLRDKGFDMPDPKIEGGGMSMSLDGGGDFDPEDPAFQAANEECMEKHMGIADEPRVQEEP